MGVARVFGFLALCVFLHGCCCFPQWVVMFGGCLCNDVEVGMSVRGVASDCV
jgi:hypothetical protein